MNYVYSAVGCIIVVFILLILKKKKKAKADYLLIAINLILGAYLLSDILVNRSLTSATITFQNVVPLLLFPVFVTYIHQYTHAKKKTPSFQYALYLPFLILSSWSLVDHFVLNSYDTQEKLIEHFNTPTLPYQIIFKGSQILVIGVLIYLLRALKQFKIELKEGYSSIEDIDVKWLRNFTWVYLITTVLTFVLFIAQNLNILPIEVSSVYIVTYGVLTISIFYLTYEGIQHYTLSQLDDRKEIPKDLEEVKPEVSTSERKEVSVELKEEELKIEMIILEEIEQQRLYLNPKLSLDDLAAHTQKNKHIVSKVINAREGRSFYDLINGYRVEHLKKLLDDPKNKSFTILSLALDSGFNSKASLNRIFKSVSGLTPKQYLDKSQNQ